MSQRALITGVSGFVGGHLAEHLLECGDAVLGTAPDELPPPSRPLPAAVQRVAFDLTAADPFPAESRRAIRDFIPTHVYHLAAISVPQDCGQAEPTPVAWRINVEGVRRVLELVEALPGRPRVLFISTSHVYRPVSQESPLVDERSPLGPTNAYGRTKLAAEEIVADWAAGGRGEPVIVRAFKHTGPGQGPQMMVPEWAAQFAAGADPVVIRSRGSYLDLCDVRDVVRAYRLLAASGRSAETYNMGSGLNRSSGEIFDLLHRLADPSRGVTELRPGLKQEPIADCSKLLRDCGWKPQIPLEQTLRDTLQWWQQQNTVASQVSNAARPTNGRPDSQAERPNQCDVHSLNSNKSPGKEGL